MSAASDPIQDAFAAVQERWRRAIHAHRLAPPDAGFSARLADLAAVARAEARVCRKAAAAGYSWPAHSATAQPPYELQPGTGRRGPEALWARFDAAAAELNRAGGGTDLMEVARAHELLADAADALAVEVEREDRASGLLPQADARKRRSA
ncbi:MAG: hypothetical protein ABR946_06385 [Solirubrobacteraceae bacterium]